MAAWFGSKATSGLCQAILSLVPPHRVYIESHLGGGAIMKRKPPALRSIGIDRNRRAIDRFSCGHPVELLNCCAHDFLSWFDFEGDELVYSDPPYLQATRRSGRRYRYDYEDEDHVELLRILKSLPCRVILSGYPSRLYDEMLPGWRRISLQVNNQACVVTEVLWFNFEPDRMHWPGFAGRGKGERQRIRRKAANWGRMYEAMPPGERLSVLWAIMAVEAEEAGR